MPLTAVCVCSGMSRAAGFQAQDSTLPASRLFSQACFSSSSQHPIPPCSLLVTRTDEQMSAQLVIAGKETVTEEAEVTAVVQLSPAVFGRWCLCPCSLGWCLWGCRASSAAPSSFAKVGDSLRYPSPSLIPSQETRRAVVGAHQLVCRFVSESVCGCEKGACHRA